VFSICRVLFSLRDEYINSHIRRKDFGDSFEKEISCKRIMFPQPELKVVFVNFICESIAFSGVCYAVSQVYREYNIHAVIFDHSCPITGTFSKEHFVGG